MFSKSIQNLISIFLISFSFFIFTFSFSLAQTLQIPGSLLLGQTQQKTSSVKLTANDFTLVWSAGTYTPFGYQGKALPTYDSQVKISVIPITKAGANPPALLYRWSLDSVFDEGNSGKNRTAFLFKTSAIAGSRQYIDVKILDTDENELFTLSTSVPIVSSQVAILPSDKQAPDFGAVLTESPAISFGQDQIFSAIPYFFDIANLDNLNYQWTFDGSTINKTEEKNKFSIKAPGSDSAETFTKTLSVSAINPFDDIQRAASNIEITFQK